MDYDGLCGAEEGEELKGDGEQRCEMFYVEERVLKWTEDKRKTF